MKRSSVRMGGANPEESVCFEICVVLLALLFVQTSRQHIPFFFYVGISTKPKQ